MQGPSPIKQTEPAGSMRIAPLTTITLYVFIIGLSCWPALIIEGGPLVKLLQVFLARNWRRRRLIVHWPMMRSTRIAVDSNPRIIARAVVSR
ncbi:hypothetical protein C7374_12018 [Falsochrobactrum ovis]|uniref:Uncharacterized protein n=1 Tax=Falsochrobactrum ovis TaxID=1293442 RepID=A0A364JRZ3_9HYPH|nr:hypothetical protein C7374_12018 [Falsochrobactrum ovis]